MAALRSIPESFAADEVAAIDARLDAVVRDEHVTIPPAIASFIAGEYDLAHAAERGPLPDDTARRAAEAMFLELLARFGPAD